MHFVWEAISESFYLREEKELKLRRFLKSIKIHIPFDKLLYYNIILKKLIIK